MLMTRQELDELIAAMHVAFDKLQDSQGPYNYIDGCDVLNALLAAVQNHVLLTGTC